MSYAQNEDRERAHIEREIAKMRGDAEESEMVRDHVINSLQHLEKIQCATREFVDGLREKLDPILRVGRVNTVARNDDAALETSDSFILRHINDAMEYERVTLELLREIKERIDLP